MKYSVAIIGGGIIGSSAAYFLARAGNDVSVAVIEKEIGWPQIETDEYIIVLGSARPLLQALQHATTELQRWLMTDYGYDERGSSLLMGTCLNTKWSRL